ncbi:MAG: leucyl aminopeptidase [Pseudomonadota bacterium]
MTTPISIDFLETDLDGLADQAGRIAVIVTPEGTLDLAARRVNRQTKGAVARLLESDKWGKLKEGDGISLNYPTGLAATAVMVLKLGRRAPSANARAAGAELAKFKGKDALTIYAGSLAKVADLSFGLAVRNYAFEDHKTDDEVARKGAAIHCKSPEDAAAEAAPMAALAEGVFFTRDLVNEPSNILTTDDFAARLAAMGELGLEVEILEEPELEKLGMRTLLAVGMGSESPSKVVVMQHKGGGDEAPLALVGKGVVFDTGGISLKPAGGMEDMTMDMGGAGVVAGVMRTLALRKAKANVVGLVGLVENMPDGRAQRPGDVVKSMKGDTVEVINTDAEGRLVLADVLWYAQEKFAPKGIVDLATLTGAIIIGLGHENAGVFSNNDDFCAAFLKAAATTGEGAWRMPLGAAYDKQLKSDIADMKNVGGRAAGSITAAQFLQRFIKDEMPWIHLDIAGVAHVKSATAMAPKGATGWGVAALDQLVRDGYEAE